MTKTVKQLHESHGAFADWVRENKANKKADRERGRAEAHARHKAQIARIGQEKTIRKHHEGLIKNVYKAEHQRSQAEWEDAVAAVADHQRKHSHLRLPGHLGEQVETYLDDPVIARLNSILTELTGKLFMSQHVFIEAVRAACDFHGIKLPHLAHEQETQGPNQGMAYGDLIHGPGFEMNRNTPAVSSDFEYVFPLTYGDITGGKEPELYLYMCASHIQIEGDGEYWETYAQVVTPEELSELLEDNEDEREFPANEAEGDIKSQKRGSSGLSPESDGNHQ